MEERLGNPFDDDDVVVKEDDVGNPFDDEDTTTDTDSAMDPGPSKERTDAIMNNEEIAAYLLEQNHVLTALEFYQELLEDGCDLQVLRDYFAKEATILREASFDSLDSASSYSDSNSAQTSNQFSKLMRERDEKIALLEYELRLSREDVESLRNEIKQIVLERSKDDQAVSVIAPNSEEVLSRTKEANELVAEKPMAQLEKRALNWMIKHYLTKGYKLSAITFSGEVADQNLEHWDDNISEPPSLLSLHRFFYSSRDRKKEEAMMNEIKEEKENSLRLQRRLELAEKKISVLEGKKVSLEETVNDLKQQNSILEEKIVSYYKSKRERDERDKKDAEEREKREKEKEEKERRDNDRERKEGDAGDNGDKAKAKEEGQNVDGQSSVTDATSEVVDQKVEQIESGDFSVSSEHGEEKDPSAVEKDITVEETRVVDEEEEERIDHIGEKRRARVEKVLVHAKGTSPMDASRVAKEVQRIVGMDDDNLENTVRIVAECLPNIVPGVLLNTRSELIPVILCAIKLHPEAGVREQLTQLLFNLIKVPDENQRRIIMIACTALSKIIGLNRTANELLPHCWEQLTNKHEERRVLVAEACGSLSAYVQPDLRPSLILSIITQLFDDQSVLVREAIVKNLTLLVSHFRSEEMIKYTQVEELLFKLLWDKHENIVTTTQELFLPVFCDWVDAEGALSDKFCTSLLTQLMAFAKKTQARQKETTDLATLFSTFEWVLGRFYETLLLSSLSHIYRIESKNRKEKSEEDNNANSEKETGEEPSANKDEGTDEKNEAEDELGETKSSEEETKTSKLVPALFERKKDTQEGENALVSSAEKEILVKKFDEFLRNGKEHISEASRVNWSHMSWLGSVFLPKISEILALAKDNKSQEFWATFKLGMSRLVYVFCELMGSVFVDAIAYPFFVKEMQASKEKKAALLHAFVLGILPFLGTKRLFDYLKEVIVNIAMVEEGWDGSHLPLLNDCLPLLCKQEEIRVGLLSVLWELVVHPSPQVRIALVKIFDKTATFLKAAEISSRVLPALITMGNDVEVSVRLAAVRPIGNIAVLASDPLVLEKVNAQFQTFMEDESPFVELELINMFTVIVSQLKSTFRDAALLPKLLQLGKKNNALEEDSRRIEVAKALFETYRAYSSCTVSGEVVRESLIPGLELLLKDGEVMGDPGYRKMVSGTISDLQLQIKKKGLLPTIKSDEANKRKRERKRSYETAPSGKESGLKDSAGGSNSSVKESASNSKQDTPKELPIEGGVATTEGGNNAVGEGEEATSKQEGTIATPSTTTSATPSTAQTEEEGKAGVAMRAAGEKLGRWMTAFKKDGWTLTGGTGNTNNPPPKEGNANK